MKKASVTAPHPKQLQLFPNNSSCFQTTPVVSRTGPLSKCVEEHHDNGWQMKDGNEIAVKCELTDPEYFAKQLEAVEARYALNDARLNRTLFRAGASTATAGAQMAEVRATECVAFPGHPSLYNSLWLKDDVAKHGMFRLPRWGRSK